MRKNAFVSFLCIFTLILSFHLKADEKARNWIDELITAFVPHSRTPVCKLRGERGPFDNAEYKLIIAHNIETHIQELSRLRGQVRQESEIKAYFDTVLADAGTGSISGKLSEKSGGPIQNYVSLWAYNEFGRYCGYDSVMPSQDSHYKISDLKPGKYYIRAESWSYKSVYYRNASEWTKAKLVRVNKNKETRHIDFKMESQKVEKGGGSISGQVRRKDGTSMVDCEIYVYNLESNLVNSATTGFNGQYIVPDLPSGEFKVCCSYLESGVYLSIWYGGAHSFDEAVIVAVTEPKTTAHIDFILDYCGTIEGKVVGSDGKPVAFNCSVAAYDENGKNIQYEWVNEKGKFTLAGLPEGSYRLKAIYYGDENNLSGWYKNAKSFESATPVSIKPQMRKNIRIKLKRGGTIAGTVVDFKGQPLEESCEISAYNENKEFIKRTYADSKGSYRIQGLPTGLYKLYAEYTGFTAEVGQQPANEWYGGKNFFDGASFIRVKAPKTTSKIDFFLKQGGYISGIVMSPNGYPLGYSGYVYAYNLQCESAGESEILNDGLFFITGLLSGGYKLLADYSGDEGYGDEWYDNEQNFMSAETVYVTAPNRTGDIYFMLDEPGIIQGFLTDDLGNQVVDTDNAVEIFAFDGVTGEYANSTTNTFTGGYQMGLLEGNYKIEAMSFYFNWMSKPSDLAATFYIDGTSFDDPSALPVSISSGASKRLETIAMEKPKGSISGKVFGGDSGLPIMEEEYIVFVFDKDGYLVGGSGYSEYNNPISGEYRVGGLQPGNYYLLAWLMDESPWQWYGGVDVSIDWQIFTPEVDIPLAAIAVTVGSGDTGGIDFYMNVTKK